MKSLSIKKENIFCCLVLLLWTQSILLTYVRAVIMRIPLIGTYSDLIITILFAVLILFSLPNYTIHRNDLIFVVIIEVVFGLEWLFYEAGAPYLDRYAIDFCLKAVPLYIVGVSLSNSDEKEKVIHLMYILSMSTLVASILYQFIFAAPMDTVTSQYIGNMDLAYKLLPHCCLIAHYAVKKTKIWNVGLSVVAALYLLMLGTRGAALIYLICIALLLMSGRNSKWVIARVAVVFGAIVTFVVSPLCNAAILWLSQKAQHFGLSIRIFDKLISGEATQSIGRNKIHETLWIAIKEKSIFGNGLCSDRVLSDSYAHNIVIELWVEFGILIGTLLFFAIVFWLLFGFLSAKDENEKGLIFALICASFCKLFFSGSYLDERWLFFLLGLCVCSIRNRKTEITDSHMYDEQKKLHTSQ